MYRIVIQHFFKILETVQDFKQVVDPWGFMKQSWCINCCIALHDQKMRWICPNFICFLYGRPTAIVKFPRDMHACIMDYYTYCLVITQVDMELL